MRLATSAMAAASGLLLLGLAFYGQPAVYLHQAREQWDALMDHPQTDQAAESETDPGPERAAQLQREVARLQAELAATRALDARPQAMSPSDPVVAPSDASSASSQAVPAHTLEPANGRAAGLPDVAQLPLQPSPSSNPVPTSTLTSSKPASQAPLPAQPPSAPARPTSAAGASSSFTTPAQLDQPATEDLPASSIPRVAPTPPAPTMPPERHDVAGSSPPSRSELSKTETATPTPLKPTAQKLVAASPGLPQPAPSRQDADDTQSVLVRLRQGAPGNPPIQQADIPVQASPKPHPSLSPLLPKLGAARAALTNGQIEDARRLLQETQLQLVFRPLDTVDEASPSAGRGAADVAHALEALSASDVPLSRSYIDVALDDLSGNPARPPVRESSRRPSGYAPAYPPR